MGVGEVRAAVEKICTQASLARLPSIQAIYLSGSLARGDWVPEHSDVDLVVVGDEILQQDADKLAKSLRGMCGDIEVSVSTHSIRDLNHNRVKAFILASDSTLLCGKDLLQNLERPTAEAIRSYGLRMLKRHADDWIRAHKEGRTGDWREEGSGEVYMVLKLAQDALLSRGTMSLEWEEVADRFACEFKDRNDLVLTVSDALDLRSRWGSVRSDKQKHQQFSRRAIRYARLLAQELVDEPCRGL